MFSWHSSSFHRKHVAGCNWAKLEEECSNNRPEKCTTNPEEIPKEANPFNCQEMINLSEEISNTFLTISSTYTCTFNSWDPPLTINLWVSNCISGVVVVSLDDWFNRWNLLKCSSSLLSRWSNFSCNEWHIY